MRILQDCSDEEMAVITAAVGAHIDACEKEATEGRGTISGWKYSGRAKWHGIGFHEAHSLRNSDISTWRKVGLFRFG
jgi:hypothetical protein